MDAIIARIKKFCDPYLAILLLTWGLVFTWLFWNMIEIRADGLWFGHENVWSDWSMHLGLSSIFAYKSPQDWFAYHPMYADGALTYPFLIHLITGMLMRLGLSIPVAFALPSILLSLLVIAGLYHFNLELRLTPRRAFGAVFLFFLASGLGFLTYLQELFENPSLQMLLYPPKQYSRWDSEQWYAGNFIVGHLLPQRAFLLGLALALWGMIFLLQKKRKRAVVVLGLLPIAHMHSFIVVVILVALWFAARFIFERNEFLIALKKELLEFLLPIGLLSSTLYLVFIAGKIENPEFMILKPWGYASSFVSWVKFWGWVWGAMIPLAIAGSVVLWRELDFRKVPKSTALLRYGFWIVFILANLVQFQPIRWDNSKMHLWVYVGLAGFVSEFLFWFWWWNPKRISRPLTILALVLVTFTGVLEVLNIVQISHHQYQAISNEEWALADEIRTKTDPRARFATDTAHNHPVMLRALRPMLLGYVAWAWNFGFLYRQTEEDLKKIFQGGVESVDLIKKHRVDYVYIGAGERRTYRANESFYRARFPVAFESPNIVVFDVRAK